MQQQQRGGAVTKEAKGSGRGAERVAKLVGWRHISGSGSVRVSVRIRIRVRVRVRKMKVASGLGRWCILNCVKLGWDRGGRF